MLFKNSWKRNITRIAGLSLSLSLCLGLIACGSNPAPKSSGTSDAQAPSTAKKLESFDLVLDWYPNAIHSYLFVGMEKGYYAEEGLELKLHYPSNPTDPLSLTAAGSADLGMFYPNDVIHAISEENLPVQMVGAVVQDPLAVVMAKKSSGIRKPEDLMGKKVGFSSIPLYELMLKTMKQSNGEPIGTLDAIDVGFDLITAVSTDQVSAVIGALVNHEVPVMEENGIPVNYFYPSDFGIPHYPELVLVANREAVSKNPEKIQAFLRASRKAFAEVKNHPQEALDTLLRHQNKSEFPLSMSVEQKSLNTLLPIMEKEGQAFFSLNKEDLQNWMQWMEEQGQLTHPVKVDEIMVNLLD